MTSISVPEVDILAPRKRWSRSIPVYGYDDHSVWLVSSQYQDAKGLKLTAKIFNLDMSEKFSKEVTLDAARGQHQRNLDAA